MLRLSPITVLCIPVCLAITACGGGDPGESTVPAPTTFAVANAPDAAMAAAAPALEEPAAPVQADESEPEAAQLVQVPQMSQMSPMPVGVAAVAAPESVAAIYSDAVIAPDVQAGAKRDALAAPADYDEGSMVAASRQVVLAQQPGGRIFYVDSRTGLDSNSGASAGGTGAGPWKTLARVASAGLKPGDIVRLACGAAWYETLNPNASGTAGAPISLQAYPLGCANPPLIDGGWTVPAASWVRHSGNIYRASVSFEPMDLMVATSPMEVAHHPNRGFNAAEPDSLFLRIAADADKSIVAGRQASTYLKTGTDLVLPAGASLSPGAAVRIRTTSWVIDEAVISAVNGNKLSLATPTEYPLASGWGYYLTGQLWMLDSPGEWFYDKSTRTLYVWMSDSQAPGVRAVAVQKALGVDLKARSYITVDGLSIQRVGTGIDMRNSVGVVVRNSKITATVGKGIDAAASRNIEVASNVFTRTGSDAVSGADNDGIAAVGMRVTNNRISNSGVVMNGETVVSLPRRSFAAIRSGVQSTVTGNVITDAGNIGIKPMAGSTVSGNYVRGACSVLDDCGGIYVSGANNNSVISGNIVEHSRGALPGKTAALRYTQAQGIYLDESATGVTVSGNTVVDADNGVHLHIAANNVIRDNKLYGNRNNQIWLQETSNRNKASGDVYANSVLNNQIVSTVPTSMGVLQSTVFSSTDAFASFDGNVYFDKVYPTIAVDRTMTLAKSYDLSDWQAAKTDNGLPRKLDVNGKGTSQLRYASYRATGGSVVPNGNLLSGLDGWTHWNLNAPFGTMLRETCQPGQCASYRAGASPGMLSTPFFPVVGGQWYRLSVDLKGSLPSQYQPVVVRNGGGGSAGYEWLSNVRMYAYAGTSWRRFSFVFQASKSVIVKDPLTGGKGARIDFEQVAPGTSISVANLEMVPISSISATTRTDILINRSATPTQIACPVATTAPELCAKYVKFSDSTPIVWPYYLGALSSEIIYTLDTTLVDSDGDGVADSQDSCAGTAEGSAVNSRGCGLGL